MTSVRSIIVKARGLSFPALSTGDGPLVICLHGFPDCLRSFRHQLPALAQAGYRVVAPALRGYAPSCTPAPSACHALEAARDVSAIADALGASQVHLIGHDWGAVAAYLAAAADPGRFLSVTALAIPHPLGIARALPRLPGQLRKSWYMAFFQARHVAERALLARDQWLIEKLWRDWSPGFAPAPEEMDAVKQTLASLSARQSALAYYRNMFNLSGPAVREAVRLLRAPIEPPFLAMTGEADGCIDTRLFDLAMRPRYFRSSKTLRLAGVGHFLHQEAPARVNAELVAWVTRNS